MERFVAQKREKVVISVRLPVDTLRIVDEKAAEADISRNDLINQMIVYALGNMGDMDK